MFGADVVGGEEGEERRAASGRLDGEAAVGFLTFDDANDSDDDHAGFARGLDGRDGGAACGADVVDDDDARAGLQEAFDAAGSAVGLLRLADKEAVDEVSFARGGGIGEGAPVYGSLGAGGGYVGDDGVRTHGEAADGLGLDVVSLEQLKNCVPGEAAALGVERGGAAVDVVVACGTGGEGELAEAKAEAGEKGEELFFACGSGHQR